MRAPTKNTTREGAVPLRGRAGAIRASAEGRSRSKRPPSHDTSRSARPRILTAAAKMAAERGYEPLLVQEITAEAGISHQAFYGHFANKRDVVAKATAEDLGAIVDLAMRGAQQDETWAERLLADVDRALIEAYPAKDGPEIRLRALLTGAISSTGGYGALRINEMIKVSRLGHGEFYRRYGGKRGCLRRIYAEVLAELRTEVFAGEARPAPLSRFGEAFASDPGRATLLVLGATHLPEVIEQAEEGRASQGSLLHLLHEVSGASAPEGTGAQVVAAIAGGVLEVIRSATIAGRLDRIEGDLGMLGRGWDPAPADAQLKPAA